MASSPFSALGNPSGELSAGASVTDGETAFGFPIPQGDPGAISAAASALTQVASHLDEQNSNIASASQVAGETGGWQGASSEAFASYARNITSVSGGNADAIDDAASALKRLSQLLDTAQTACKKALADCQTAQTAQQSAQQDVTDNTSSANAMNKLASTDPTGGASLTKQANDFAQKAQQAQGRVDQATDQLNAAKRAGQKAADEYATDAASVANQLTAAADKLKTPPNIAAGAPIPVPVSQSDAKLATQITKAAGSLKALQAALKNPAEMQKLADGQKLTPGTVLELMRALEQEEEEQKLKAAIALAREKGEPHGLLGHLEHDAGQFGSGAWGVLKGAFSTLTHPWRPFEQIIENQAWYRELFGHQNPVTAMAEQQQGEDQMTDQILDIKDLEDGDISKWLGTELTTAALFGSGDPEADEGALANLSDKLAALKEKFPDLNEPAVQGILAQMAVGVAAQLWAPFDLPEGTLDLIGSQVEDRLAGAKLTLNEAGNLLTDNPIELQKMIGTFPEPVPPRIYETPDPTRQFKGGQRPDVNPRAYGGSGRHGGGRRN